ncbi:MAG: helix-turn-helix transcriptional regulator [Peptostreptococcaceae bacterium]
MKNRIKELRSYTRLTQEEFADKIFLKKSAISAYENGTREVPDRVINNICSAFNVNKSWLVEGSGEMLIDLTAETNFSEEVKNMLRKWQTLNDKDKKAIEQLINTSYENNQKKED